MLLVIVASHIRMRASITVLHRDAIIKMIVKCVSHDITSKAQPVEVKSNIDRSSGLC